MKNSKLFYIALLILPWLTVPFLGRNSLKKYLPAGIFMCTFTKALDFFGEKKKWLRIYEGIPPLNSANFFNFGPYLVASLWMLKLTFGKFPLYLISNIILHICFNYLGGLKFLKRYKIASIDGLTKFQYLTIHLLRALLLYSFQYINNISYHTKKLYNK
ncbi:hypothetical protein J7E79_23935 [Bacillus sp. ISL-40]|uniref:hypothetical protein n=1 Tax=unclassified Bacillus (in: firmicutes) TaxID=185979 RepID=UPI001BECCEFE|nr:MULTISPECIES: hypothetical protein [unclassified Bacillus (in: firmicutes)]MBT2700409.1 hypothetical protein [Bacillus sp. ISL-40]MBT2741697.1 hypothetical protein [Bacillus sp. ISL-77]